MRAAPLLLLLSALAPTLGGCSSRDGADVDCLQGASVLLTDAAVTYVSDLPITIEVCVGSACSSFEIEHTGQAPVCVAQSAGTSICTIDEMGTVVLTALPLPAGTAAGASLPIHATLSTSGGKVYDSTHTVTVTSSQPDGCDGAETSFTPPAA